MLNILPKAQERFQRPQRREQPHGTDPAQIFPSACLWCQMATMHATNMRCCSHSPTRQAGSTSKALNLVAKAGMARPLCCTCAVMHTIQSTEATTHISFCIDCKVIYSKTDTIQLAQVRPLPTAAVAKLADQAVSAGGSQPLTVTLTLLARQAHASCPNASETPKA
jgi:hypothetical protein